VRDQREGASWTRRQRLKNDLIHALILASLAVVRLLPRGLVLALCRALGALAYRVLPRERARARQRLTAGLGAAPPEARVRGAFLTAGETLADTLALLDPRERASRTLSLDPASRRAFADALAEGRGVIYVSAHLGCWERMAALLAEEGFPVATVARESYDARLTALYERLRAPRGVRSLYRGRPGAAAAILRELRAGRAVGFLLDLPARVPSLDAPLFGAASPIPVGAVRLALRRRCAVLVGTTVPASGTIPDVLQRAPARPERASVEVRIERVSLDDLASGPAGEAALVTRLAHLLGLRIAERPEAWLGLFAPRPAPNAANNRDPSGGPPGQLRYLEDSR
jgi:KDO2-lipid IV(A) lauroyltransferase